MWIGMVVAVGIAAYSYFAGWSALALLLIICPLVMLGMMLFMGQNMNHGDNEKGKR